MNQSIQKAKWYGPKQIGIMIYAGLMCLVSTCIVGGQTNTVLPAIAALRGWDVNLLTVWAGGSHYLRW